MPTLVVVGDFDRRRQTYSAAIAVDGQRFDVRPNLVLERPRRLIEPPDDWLRRVKLLPPPRSLKAGSTGSNGATASVPATIPSRASHVDLDVADGDRGRRVRHGGQWPASAPEHATRKNAASATLTTREFGKIDV